MKDARLGLLAGGNFIVDTVKIIDHYPAENMLASIFVESQSNGGGPYNVLKDLAAMQAGFPLEAVGLIGQDAPGDWIAADCAAHGIDTTQLRRTAEAPTSYTDAMTVQSTGRRTFFHRRGANAALDETHFDFTRTQAKLFHLAYLMLLDRLDELLPESTPEQPLTRATRVLARAREAGLETSVDIVSTEHPSFRDIALAALPYADHLIINEVEASRILQTTLPAEDAPALVHAAQTLLEKGVKKTVVIHTEAGAAAVARTADGLATFTQGSLQLPAGYSQGATGAGDAFAAGYLYGLHEDWPMERRLLLAVSAAAACLSHPTPSHGLRPVAECLALADQFAPRPFH